MRVEVEIRTEQVQPYIEYRGSILTHLAQTGLVGDFQFHLRNPHRVDEIEVSINRHGKLFLLLLGLTLEEELKRLSIKQKAVLAIFNHAALRVIDNLRKEFEDPEVRKKYFANLPANLKSTDQIPNFVREETLILRFDDEQMAQGLVQACLP